MSVEDTQVDETTVRSASALGRLARQRAQHMRDLSVELPVPTWELNGRKTLLWSFKVVPKKILDKFVDSKRTLEGDIDLLVDAHNGFFFHEPSRTQPGTRLWPDKEGNDRTEYVRVEDENTGEVTMPDIYFAEVVGFIPRDSPDSPPPSTQLVLHLVQDNEAAIANLVGRVMAWQQNTDLDVTKLMLGES